MLTPRAATPTLLRRAANWGKPEIDTFKIGNLAWSVSDVLKLKPEVCFMVTKGKTILDLVPNRSPMIYWSLFDPSQNW